MRTTNSKGKNMKTQELNTRWVIGVIVIACLTISLPTAFGQIPVGTTFTYHGRFSDPNVVPDGCYDLLFELYDDPNEGNLIGVPVELSDIEIVGGSFTVELDFGNDVFESASSWLAVGVRVSGTTDSYAFLDVRQKLSRYPIRDLSVTSLFLPYYGKVSSSGIAFRVGNTYTGTSSSSMAAHFGAQGDHATGVDSYVTGWAGRAMIARAAGIRGCGVLGEATHTGYYTNYGGFFVSKGGVGYGVYARAEGYNGTGVKGVATGGSGIGVYGSGQQYDFYAGGPGPDYAHASSIRWKRNIQAIDEPLDKLMELRGVYYDWDSDHGGQHDVGMIAEEVGKVLPEIVSYEKNGIDADGMDYSKLTPLLVEAVKALKAQLDEANDQSTEKDLAIEKLTDQISELQQLRRDGEELRGRLSALETAFANMPELPSLER